MRRIIIQALCSLFLFNVLLFPALGECGETWDAVSADFREAAERLNRREADLVEIEYDGKLISVDMSDLILVTDGEGNQSIDLYDPSKYARQLANAPVYGQGVYQPGFDDGEMFRDHGTVYASGTQEITEQEYEEQQRARRWAEIIEDLTLRDIDDKALELVREYSEARSAVPPVIGDVGSLVLSYSTYTPKIICRPMYVTDVILQPGEIVTGVHPGDPVRWSFVPGSSGYGDTEQMHVLIKPLMADISTNLIINTDRRTYHLDLVSSATNHIPSVSFSYPAETLAGWADFIERKRTERQTTIELSSGYSISPEDLHLDYEIRGKDSLRWKPVRVWDDGVKTYIQFRQGSVRRSVEAPVLVLFENRRELIVNYRVAEDMYIVDRVFDTAGLIVGTGAAQDRVVITRLAGK